MIISPEDFHLEMQNSHFRLKAHDIDNLSYYEIGSSEENTLIMVHGLGGNASHFFPLAKILSKYYHIIIPDLPGYGLSPRPSKEPNKLLSYFAKIISSINKQKCEKQLHLIGHSMGGQINLIGYLKGYLKPKTMVLLAPAGIETFDVSEKEKILQGNSTEVFMNMENSKLEKLFESCFYNHNPWKDYLFQERRNQFGFEGDKLNFYQWRFKAIKSMLDEPVRTNLQDIDIPTLICFGQEDRLIPNPFLHPDMNMLEEIKSINNKNFKIAFTEAAGHMLQLDQDDLVSIQIKEFLDENK